MIYNKERRRSLVVRTLKELNMLTTTLAIGMPGVTEWIIIGALGLLIFGKRLPEVGRSLGKGIVEFKKGLKGIEEDVEMVDHDTPSTRRAIPSQEASSHKFDPQTGQPIATHKYDPHTGQPIDQDATANSSASH
jgi:sec-independent protein translocase protein TatA